MEEVQFLNFRKIFDGSCRKIALELNQLFGVELLSQSSAAASRSYGLLVLPASGRGTFRLFELFPSTIFDVFLFTCLFRISDTLLADEKRARAGLGGCEAAIGKHDSCFRETRFVLQSSIRS